VSASPVALQSSREGIVVPVQARPRGRRDGVVGVRGGALLIETVAAPEDGRANAAILRLLAEALEVARADVELKAGAAARHKRFAVRGLDAATAAARIERHIERLRATARGTDDGPRA
jgi:uncharacterized protein (TIGR00251 family)